MDNPSTFCIICFTENVDLIDLNAKDCNDDLTYCYKLNYCSFGIVSNILLQI